MNSLYCENWVHDNKVKLTEINDGVNGKLLVCEKCGDLYFLKNKDNLTLIGNQSILISNIDSDNKNFINCKCGGRAYSSSYKNSSLTWYWCPICHNMYIKLKNKALHQIN